MTVEIIICLTILTLFWYWSSAIIVQEHAYHAVKQHCQLLDEAANAAEKTLTA